MATQFDPNNAQNLMEVRLLCDTACVRPWLIVLFWDECRSRSSEFTCLRHHPRRCAPPCNSVKRLLRFAVKAVEQAQVRVLSSTAPIVSLFSDSSYLHPRPQTYWNLLEKVEPKDLKLTKYAARLRSTSTTPMRHTWLNDTSTDTTTRSSTI